MLTNSFIFRPPVMEPHIKFRKDSKNSEKLLIYFHGNAEDVHTSKSYCQWLADSTQFNLITCDYPGYGFSTGSTSESGMNDAGMTLLEFALSDLNHQMNQIIIVGKSLGSVPAIYTASQAVSYDLGGLVLIAPVASGIRCLTASNNIPEFFLHRLDPLILPSITRIQNVCCPIQFIHGSKDDVVPVSNTHALMAVLHCPCLTKPLFVNASHNNIESVCGNLFINTIKSFIQKCTERSLSKSEYQ
jgi:pimeloyl-ACP methyl ester carboxylesterase